MWGKGSMAKAAVQLEQALAVSRAEKPAGKKQKRKRPKAAAATAVDSDDDAAHAKSARKRYVDDDYDELEHQFNDLRQLIKSRR